jgi:serine/threonine-protein kinase
MNPDPPSAYDRLTPQEAAQIDAICDRFEQAWREVKTGAPAPRLVSYMGDGHGSMRDVLFRELNVLDQAYRERYSLAVRPEECDGPRQSLGRYTLSRIHGKGGIGQVWLARDHDLGRDVALKELRPEREDDPAIGARFLEEARITGQLEHPAIVPLYELGRRNCTNKPFYTMRFIKGRTLADAIERYHEDLKSGKAEPLALRELLGAFVAVSNAIAYAHSRGVMHRDLKPQNIVLGDFGEVIVLDWGLAKLMGQKEANTSLLPVSLEAGSARDDTVLGEVLGTPAYMPPEQAAGRLDLLGERSDVYGLGAILYEILTGEAPFTGEDSQHVLRRVMQEAPAAPRRLVTSTSPALEAVCLKALCKRPSDRYTSAKEVAQEVQRWLADEPVAAYPEPWTTRVRRFVANHRTVVTGVAATILVAVICLGTATGLLTAANQRERDARSEATRERDEARRQKERADQNLAQARKVVEDYCTNLSEDQRLKQQDLRALRKKLLETAVPFYEKVVRQKVNDPALLADKGLAYWRLALVRAELGEHAQAQTEFTKAIELQERLAAEHPSATEYNAQLAISRKDLSWLLRTVGRREEAEAECIKAIDLLERLTAANPTVPEYCDTLARSRNNLGVLLHDQGRPEEAREQYVKVIGLRERLTAEHPSTAEYQRRLAGSRSNLGLALSALGRNEKARAEYTKAIELQVRLVSEHPSVPEYRCELARSRNNVGNCLYDIGRREEARAEYIKAIELQVGLVSEHRSVPEYRFELARSRNNLGNCLSEMRRREESREEYAKAIELQVGLVSEHPSAPEYRSELARSRNNLSNTLSELGEREEARAEYTKAIEIYVRLVSEHPSVPEYRYRLALAHADRGESLRNAGKQDEARAEYQKALELQERLAADFPGVPDYAIYLATTHGNYGHLLRDAGHPAESLAWFGKAMSSLRNLLIQEPQLAHARAMLRQVTAGKALALARLRRYTEAVKLADTVAEDKELSEDALYYSAATLALCSAGNDASLAERSVTLLGRGQTAGYFKTPTKLQRLKTTKDFDTLRQRDDFKKLLLEVEAKPLDPN